MSYLILFASFFRIGLFGFGGGIAMLPLIYQSVQQFGFMAPEEFSDLLALSQVTPGPIAVNAATYVGFHFAGVPGAVCATIGVVLPAFIIMMIVSGVLDRFKANPLIRGAFEGIRPVTVGMIAAAVIFVAEGVLVKGEVISPRLFEGAGYYDFAAIGIALAAGLMMGLLKMKPIGVMLIMAGAGALLGGLGLAG